MIFDQRQKAVHFKEEVVNVLTHRWLQRRDKSFSVTRVALDDGRGFSTPKESHDFLFPAAPQAS